MKVKILGCGGSGGVPLATGKPGGDWRSCSSDNPRNMRRRCSVHLETGQGAGILIDTAPDLRAQVLSEGVQRIDMVLFTHDHADHTHGLDDLRAFAYGREHPIPAYMSRDTHGSVTPKFSYAFESTHTNSRLYPAMLSDRVFDYGEFEAEGIPITAIRQSHGNIETTGFRIGKFAYSTDVVDFQDKELEKLKGIDVWIVDSLRMEPHPTHAHFEKTLEWIREIQPRQAVLTHMNHTMDYERVKQLCPEGVEPAYDGMVLQCDG